MCAPSIARDGPDHPAFGSCRTIYDPAADQTPKRWKKKGKKNTFWFFLILQFLSKKKKEKDKYLKRNSYRHLFIFLRFPNYFDREEGERNRARAANCAEMFYWQTFRVYNNGHITAVTGTSHHSQEWGGDMKIKMEITNQQKCFSVPWFLTLLMAHWWGGR